MNDTDKDLGRILKLVDIIKRYEYLVDHLLCFQSTRLYIPGECLTDYIAELRRAIVNTTLINNNGNVNKTAKELGIARSSVCYNRLETEDE